MRSPIVRTPRIMLVLASLAVIALAAAAPAFAEGPTVAHWHLEGSVAPRYLPLAKTNAKGEKIPGEGEIIVTASNLGDADLHGETSTVTLTDTLPKGVEASAPAKLEFNIPGSQTKSLDSSCAAPTGERREINCTYKTVLSPYEQIELVIKVNVNEETAFDANNLATVAGGGANNSGSIQEPLEISGAPTHFGVEAYEQTPETEEFTTDTQAGSHPFQLTTTLDFNETTGIEPPAPGGKEDQLQRLSPAPPRNLSFRLPAGLIGDVKAAPTCSDIDFGSQEQSGINACSNETVVGVVAVTYVNPTNNTGQLETRVAPVFNLAPSPGEPARFGFSVIHVPVVLDTSVRTGEDYGVTVSVHNASEAVQVLTNRVTFWGMPGDKRHNESRGWSSSALRHETATRRRTVQRKLRAR